MRTHSLLNEGWWRQYSAVMPKLSPLTPRPRQTWNHWLKDDHSVSNLQIGGILGRSWQPVIVLEQPWHCQVLEGDEVQQDDPRAVVAVAAAAAVVVDFAERVILPKVAKQTVPFALAFPHHASKSPRFSFEHRPYQGGEHSGQRLWMTASCALAHLQFPFQRYTLRLY